MYIILIGIIVIIVFIIYSDYVKKVFNGPDSITLENISKCVKMILWNEPQNEQKLIENVDKTTINNKKPIKPSESGNESEIDIDNNDVESNNQTGDMSVSTSNVSGSLTLMSSNGSGSSSDNGTYISGVTIENPKAFLEFGSKEGVIGTINVELFEEVVPRTVKNFLGFIDGFEGNSYDKCNVHRIIPGFMLQTGDYERGDGTGGSSIYGKYFEDETFECKHDQPGLLSMANAGPNTNGSQFFITFEMTPWLDDKHVVFGRVLDDNSMTVLKKLEKLGTSDGKPKKKVKIINCGRL